MEILGHRPHLLKELNRAAIMRIVWNEGPISRADISRKTGLSVPGILKIVDGLHGDGLLREIGEGESSGGRRPVLLDINPKGAYAVGVELTPGRIRGALVSLDFEIVARDGEPIDAESGYKVILDQILVLINRIVAISKIDSSMILGVGIAHPGVMGEETGKILLASNLKSWKDVSLGEDLEQRLGFPVALEVDARVLASTEMWLGGAAEIKNFLSIDIDYGLGSGLVIDGTIYRGTRGIAGELGHMVTELNGFPCACGKTGCLETVVAYPAIIREAARNPSPLLLNICGKDSGRLRIEHILEAAHQNDQGSLQAIERSARALGTALGNLLNCIDVEAIFITSALMQLGDRYLVPLREEFGKYFLLPQEKPVKILPSTLGEDSELLGAAILILRDVFSNGRKKSFKGA